MESDNLKKQGFGRTYYMEGVIYEALMDALAIPTDKGKGMSVRDLHEKTGANLNKIRAELRKLLERGECTLAHRQEMAIDGRMRRVPVYVFGGENGRV